MENLPEFGSVEYLHRMMQYWLEKSIELRERYTRGAEDAKNDGKDPYYWPSDLIAKGIVADQRAAREECAKYAVVLSAEVAYQEHLVRQCAEI